MYQQNKSSESKVKFRQASNRCKGVLDAAKRAYANKKKSPLLPRNLALRTFGKLSIVLLTNTNLLYCKCKCRPDIKIAENSSKNCNLDDSGISLPVFPSRTNLKLYDISVSRKMVKKVITNLDLSKASGPDRSPVVVIENCEPEHSYILAELFN